MVKNQNIFNKKSILFSIIISLLFISCHNYVLIQMKKFEKESSSISNDYTPERLINNLYNQHYGLLNIGNPTQKTEVQISFENYGFIMKEDICLTSNYYNKSQSLTLNETYFTDKNQTIVVEEKVDFQNYNSTTNKISETSIPNYNFIYYKTEEDKENMDKEKACIIFGFKVTCDIGMIICNSIPGYLKRDGLTNSQNFLFLYHTDEEKKLNGYDISLLIGENPHNFNKEKYHEDYYMKSSTLFWKGQLTWALKFRNYYDYNGDRIYFNYKKEEQVYGIFLFYLDIIIGINDYFKSIKLNYFDKYEKECSINLINSQYNVISCDKNFNTDNFPNLYFYNTDYNYTFKLTHKDLFQIRGDRIYFLVIFDENSDNSWKFGKLFMQKYFFNFDVESRTIGFYTDLNDSSDDEKNENKKNDNSTSTSSTSSLWILWVVLLIITGVGCFLLGRIIYNKNRKKRANELEDDYEYKEKNNDENFVNDSNGNNKLGVY